MKNDESFADASFWVKNSNLVPSQVQLLLPPKDVSDSAEADQLGILEPPPQPTEESEADLQHHLQRLHEHMDTLDMSSVKSNLKERGC